MRKRYTRTATAWYVKYPGDVYALGPIRFNDPVGVMTVREWLKEWEKVSKLPVGIEMWPA